MSEGDEILFISFKQAGIYISEDVKNIDDFGFNGDFTESQAFGYLAIRSYLGLPISFPETTSCKDPTVGGEINKNF